MQRKCQPEYTWHIDNVTCPKLVPVGRWGIAMTWFLWTDARVVNPNVASLRARAETNGYIAHVKNIPGSKLARLMIFQILVSADPE